MGLCCLPSQFWFLPFQAEAPGLPWRFTLVFVTWKVSGWGRSPGLKPISEIIFSPSNWFQEEHLTRGANDATRECVGWEVLALFPWKQNLKGVAEAFAAILLQKRSFLRTEPTERKMALFLRIRTTRNLFVKSLFGTLYAAASKACIFLEVSLCRASSFTFC